MRSTAWRGPRTVQPFTPMRMYASNVSRQIATFARVHVDADERRCDARPRGAYVVTRYRESYTRHGTWSTTVVTDLRQVMCRGFSGMRPRKRPASDTVTDRLSSQGLHQPAHR